MNIIGAIRRITHPVLKKLYSWYSSKERWYKYENIRLKIAEGVFHPGLFFSTKALIEYLKTQQLSNLKVLELGAGSGLISFYCAKYGAISTASDINPNALKALYKNSQLNNIKIEIIQSDLFQNLIVSPYDLVIINPPYYPKKPSNFSESAWFCGEHFEYFHQLFDQIVLRNDHKTIMILSSDCDYFTIKSIATNRSLTLKKIYRKDNKTEKNFIYQIQKQRP